MEMKLFFMLVVFLNNIRMTYITSGGMNAVAIMHTNVFREWCIFAFDVLKEMSWWDFIECMYITTCMYAGCCGMFWIEKWCSPKLSYACNDFGRQIRVTNLCE